MLQEIPVGDIGIEEVDGPQLLFLRLFEIRPEDRGLANADRADDQDEPFAFLDPIDDGS